MSKSVKNTAETDGPKPERSLGTVVRGGLRLCVLFVVMAALLPGCLLAAASIPKSAIRTNLVSSVSYLSERENYEPLIEDADYTKIDHLADAVLLNIAWNLDPSELLSSVMRAPCYRGSRIETRSLQATVLQGAQANEDYVQYWHGSLALVLPLLVLMPLQGIYILNYVILAALAAWLLWLLLRGGDRPAAIGVALAMLCTTFFFAPLSLEYTWVCLLTLALSALVLTLERKGKLRSAAAFFLAAGIVTNFLDFLTAETLTLLIPLLLLLRERSRKGARTNGQTLRTLLCAGLAWGVGYAGMFGLKWLLASLVLGRNVLPEVISSASRRLDSALTGLSSAEVTLEALRRNLNCLLPIGFGQAGKWITVALVLGAACWGVARRRRDFDGKLIGLYALLGLAPYVRFLVLRNHSYGHYFFTCRAQMATVLAAVLILAELEPWKGGRRWKKKRRKGRR